MIKPYKIFSLSKYFFNNNTKILLVVMNGCIPVWGSDVTHILCTPTFFGGWRVLSFPKQPRLALNSLCNNSGWPPPSLGLQMCVPQSLAVLLYHNICTSFSLALHSPEFKTVEKLSHPQYLTYHKCSKIEHIIIVFLHNHHLQHMIK